MYFWIVRLLHIPTSIFFGIVDLLFSPIYWLLGYQSDAFLNQWQKRLGPLPPIAKPVRLPGEPNYPFSIWDTVGHFRAAVIADYIDEAAARAVLPDYLELGDPGPGVPAGKHPALLIFGFEESIRPRFAPWPGVSYTEFIIALTNTRLKGAHDGYAEPFFYMPQLRLIRLYPILLGLMVGYRKVCTRTPATENTFDLKSLFGGRKIASCSVQPRGEPRKVSGLNRPAIDAWKQRLNQPMAAKLGFTGILFTHYQWEWESAIFQPAEASFRVQADRIPVFGPRPKPYSWPAFSEETGTGAMLLSLPFDWLAPFNRKVLDEHHSATAGKARAAAG